LDLGAGKCKDAISFVKRGASVIAVDQKSPEEKIQGKIIFIQQAVQEYISGLENEERFDLIYARNLLQFLDKAYVLEIMLPKLVRCLNRNGTIAIQTFLRESEPSFNYDHRYYEVSEITKSLPEMSVIKAAEYKIYGPGMDDVYRNFNLTDVIAKRTQ
jgi:trans-aconitate methyltransferase